MEISIGELARRTQVKIPTIRYYEQVGLLPAPERTQGKQRRYEASHVGRLNFIRHARELGFEVEAIRELLALSAEPNQSCAAIDVIASRHVAEIDRRISHLTSLRRELVRTLNACGRGQVRNCCVIETLAASSHHHQQDGNKTAKPRGRGR